MTTLKNPILQLEGLNIFGRYKLKLHKGRRMKTFLELSEQQELDESWRNLAAGVLPSLRQKSERSANYQAQ